MALGGQTGMRPKFALMPIRPVRAQGARIEPPASEPSAIAVTPAATEALAPPLDPPGVSATFHGLRVLPWIRLLVTPW